MDDPRMDHPSKMQNFRITPNQKLAVQRISFVQNRPESAIFRDALDNYINQWHRTRAAAAEKKG